MFNGYYEGGTSGAPFPGPNVAPSQGVTISNNICNGNLQYGIAVQGRGIAVTSNVCRRNGDSGSAFGGINCASYGTLISHNYVEDNNAWGIDIGGSFHSVVSNNYVGHTGLTSGSLNCTGLNIGGTVNCVAEGNILDNNHNASGVGTEIFASGYEAGGSYFPTIGQNLTLSNNKLVTTSSSSQGILIANGMDNVHLLGNSTAGFAAGNSFILNGGANFFGLQQRDNVDWSSASVVPTVASATTLVIPDVSDLIVITGTTAPTNIFTKTANTFNQKVRFIQITNGGSGYNPASPPTVSFSGGGGSGAAGTALVTNSGVVIGVQITNNGSGYTSAPTVAFSSGAATATAIVGCNNFFGRIITLWFGAGMTITAAGNISLASSFTTRSGGGSTLTLRGLFGTWYEVSRTA